MNDRTSHILLVVIALLLAANLVRPFQPAALPFANAAPAQPPAQLAVGPGVVCILENGKLSAYTLESKSPGGLQEFASELAGTDRPMRLRRLATTDTTKPESGAVGERK